MTLHRRLGLWLVAAAIGGMTMGTGATALAGHGSCGSWNSHASRGSFGGGGLFGRFRGNSHHNNCYDHHANYNSCGSAGQTPTYSTTTAYADDCGCSTTTSHAAYGTPTPVHSDQQGYQQDSSYQDVPPPSPSDGSSSSQGRSAADGGSPPPPPSANKRSGNQQGQPSGSGSGNANDPERA